MAIAIQKNDGTYVAPDGFDFNVTKTETVQCSLVSMQTGKPVVVAQRTKAFECVTPTQEPGADDITIGSDDPIDPRPSDIKSGDFTVIDKNGTACPREPTALINFTLRTEKSVHWSLDCTNGHHSGVAQPVVKQDGTFVAPAAVKMKVTETGRVSCALKSVSPGKPKTHKLKGVHFQCIKSTVDTSNDLTDTAQPEPAADSTPDLTVPEISCRGGKVRKGACVCPRDRELRKLGPRRFRCIRTVPELTCKNGTAHNNTCACPQGWPRKKTGNRQYVCKKPATPVSCKNGSARNGNCVCPKGWAKTKTGTRRYVCNKPQPKLTCIKGKVRGSKCICPSGFQRKQLSASKFSCKKPQGRKLICKGGTARGKSCICPQGYKRKKAGHNHFWCKKKKRPTVKCVGGKIKGGRCKCGRRKTLVNGRCIKPAG